MKTSLEHLPPRKQEELRAYIDARYVKSYRITPEELAAIGQHVRAFMGVVERVCREKIASLRAAAEPAAPP